METTAANNPVDDESNSFIEVARVVKPQGIKGELKLLPFSPNLHHYTEMYLGRDSRSLRLCRVERLRVTHGAAILKLQGLDDRAAAEQYRDFAVLVRREQLLEIPEGEYFIRDLIGMQVVSEQGEVLGTLSDVLELPAHDVYQIRQGERELLIPAIAQVILEVRLDDRRMVVRLPEDLAE